MEVARIVNIVTGFAIGILLRLYLSERKKVNSLSDLYNEERAKNANPNADCPDV